MLAVSPSLLHLQTALLPPAVAAGPLVLTQTSLLSVVSAGVGQLPSSGRTGHPSAGVGRRRESGLWLRRRGCRSAGAARRPCQTKNLSGQAAKMLCQRVHLLLGASGLCWIHCTGGLSALLCLCLCVCSMRFNDFSNCSAHANSQEIGRACVDAEPSRAAGRPCESHGGRCTRMHSAPSHARDDSSSRLGWLECDCWVWGVECFVAAVCRSAACVLYGQLGWHWSTGALAASLRPAFPAPHWPTCRSFGPGRVCRGRV